MSSLLPVMQCTFQMCSDLSHICNAHMTKPKHAMLADAVHVSDQSDSVEDIIEEFVVEEHAQHLTYI